MATMGLGWQSSAGYWRGGFSDGPLWQGQGGQGVRGYGPTTQGIGVLPQGQGTAGAKAWSPTLFYLFALVIVEMVVFKCLEKVLR